MKQSWGETFLGESECLAIDVYSNFPGETAWNMTTRLKFNLRFWWEVTEAEYRRIVADRRTEWVRGPNRFCWMVLRVCWGRSLFLSLKHVGLKIRKVTLRFTTIIISFAAVLHPSHQSVPPHINRWGCGKEGSRLPWSFPGKTFFVTLAIAGEM